jgi:hypothetical protein
MHSLDILYYSLALGFLILVGFASYALYQLAHALRAIKRTTERMGDITEDIQKTKDRVKATVVDGIVGILGMFGKK